MVASSTTFRIGVDTPGSAVTVQIQGPFDLDAWRLVEDALRPLVESGARSVTFDLNGVVVLEPQVVAALVQLHRRRVQVLCANPSRAAVDVLKATGAALVLGVSLA